MQSVSIKETRHTFSLCLVGLMGKWLLQFSLLRTIANSQIVSKLCFVAWYIAVWHTAGRLFFSISAYHSLSFGQDEIHKTAHNFDFSFRFV